MSRTTERLTAEAKAEMRHRAANFSDPLRGISVRTDHLLSLLDDADELDGYAARDERAAAARAAWEAEQSRREQEFSRRAKE